MYLHVILPISILDLGGDGFYEGKKRQATMLLRHFRGARLANLALQTDRLTATAELCVIASY